MMTAAFLKGFATQQNEIYESTLPVKGTIPTWVNGSLFRNGPGLFEVDGQKFKHWFDGQALLHRFKFNNGTVSYQNKYIESRGYKAIKEKGKVCFEEFATTVMPPFYMRMIPRFIPPKFSHNTLVNIIKVKDHFLTVTETPEPNEVCPESLETLGVFDYKDDIKGQMSTAHFQYDQDLKTLYNFNYILGISTKYCTYFIPNGFKKRVKLGEFAVKEPGYMHSFAMTENYFILTEAPLVCTPKDIVMSGKPFIENYKWKPENGTRFIVFNKDDGELQGIYKTDAFFYFHHINAFEEDDEIVIDIPIFENDDMVSKLYLDKLSAPNGGCLDPSIPYRFRLNTGTKTVSKKQLSNASIELPRINYNSFNMKPYQYCYGVGIRDDKKDDFLNQLVKIDTHSGDATYWFEELCYPGEPVFIPKPDQSSELDGIIASVLLNGNTETSFLLLLDPKTFTEIARIELPQHIPFGFHGDWFAE